MEVQARSGLIGNPLMADESAVCMTNRPLRVNALLVSCIVMHS